MEEKDESKQLDEKQRYVKPKATKLTREEALLRLLRSGTHGKQWAIDLLKKIFPQNGETAEHAKQKDPDKDKDAA